MCYVFVNNLVLLIECKFHEVCSCVCFVLRGIPPPIIVLGISSCSVIVSQCWTSLLWSMTSTFRLSPWICHWTSSKVSGLRLRATTWQRQKGRWESLLLRFPNESKAHVYLPMEERNKPEQLLRVFYIKLIFLNVRLCPCVFGASVSFHLWNDDGVWWQFLVLQFICLLFFVLIWQG